MQVTASFCGAPYNMLTSVLATASYRRGPVLTLSDLSLALIQSHFKSEIIMLEPHLTATNLVIAVARSLF